MDKSFDLLAAGEALLRLSPPDGERLSRGDAFVKQLGGAELNVLAGASQLGLSCGMISKLPANDIGSFARNVIRMTGVSDACIADDGEKDARLGIYYYEGAAYPRKPRVVYDRLNSSFRKLALGDFDESMYASARCFHTSGITLAISKSVRDTVIEMMRRFKAQGATISFDVNFRGNLWSGEEARACIESILPLVDIFFCSESTAHLTFHKEGTLEDIMRSFAKEYPLSVVAATQRTVHSPKRHTFGSVLYSAKEDKFYTEEPYRDIEVVDRIGSGDAYVGGLLYGLLSDPGNYQRAVEYGHAMSAVKNTVPGDLPSTFPAEIAEVIAAHKDKGEQLEMAR
ncbi:MAG: sugar kinase [Selenomonadaceae bacterium]|nr:sugar kinase [Selenomonadaceae bacterium]